MAPVQFLIDHGGPVLFAAILLDELGLPMPAVPFLVAAGALVARHQLSPGVAFGVALGACFIADTLWFHLGRSQGNRVLRLLCRISLEPDSCVSRTQNLFERYGMRVVLIAKFMPGLSAVVPPMAGGSKIPFARFLIFDAIGSAFYAATYLCAGVIFNSQLEWLLSLLSGFGKSAIGILLLVAAVYLAYKFAQRHRLLRKLRVARITVDELRKKQLDGEPLVVLDLRSRIAIQQDPAMIPGALHMTLDDVEQKSRELPRNREVIVYCSCPNEVTSARAALLLKRHGFARVRPLLGGIDAWKDRNYPTETFSEARAKLQVN
jgi:membrane protein DedA with SNARE-associated domain/rhodanese-related sulfurtransferase